MVHMGCNGTRDEHEDDVGGMRQEMVLVVVVVVAAAVVMLNEYLGVELAPVVPRVWS